MLFLATAVSLNAQTFTTPLNQGYWTLGLNGGTAYQSSDVNSTSNGLGLGLTVGKNIFHRPGAVLDFGLQGRLSYTKSTGLNTVRNYNIENNDVVNGTEGLDYRNYPDDLGVDRGFIFSNHKTQTLEGAVEAVVTLNELKEKTGVKVSLFGGLGANYFNVETDQAGANDLEYFEKYAELNERQPTSLVKKNLREAILDGEYESFADGFENGGKMKIMPSLGIEAGFQVTPKFSIDLGHRTTFSRTDQLDGEQWIDSDNDILHYTYLGTTFNFNKKEKRFLAPIISVYEPRNASLSNRRDTKVYAKIENAESAADVELLVNGKPSPFRFRNEKLSADILLQKGENEIVIIANTFAGEDRVVLNTFFEEQKTVIPPPPPPIIHNPAPIYRPVVEFIGINNNVRIREDRIKIDAVVKNVISNRDILLFVNGREANFRFDARRERISATVYLLPGENEVTLRAFNEAGEIEERMLIFFEERVPRPLVRISQPSRKFTTLENEVKVVAETEFIVDRKEAIVTVNGREIFNVDFVGNRLIAFARLKRGKNVIRILVENPSGVAEDEVVVFHNERNAELREPIVKIIAPADHETVKNKRVDLVAEIFEVARKRDIELLLNDIEIRDFDFRNNRLTATLDLEKGSNKIILRAANQDGRDEQIVIVKLKKRTIQAEMPTVDILSPKNNKTLDRNKVEIKAKIKHTRNADILVNGTKLRGVRVVNGEVKVTATLKEGHNEIKVVATNKTGTTDEEVNVFFERAEVVAIIDKPNIKIEKPGNGSVATKSFAKLEATVIGVSDLKEIDVILNGEKLRNVTLRNGKLTAMLIFVKGQNTIEVVAENAGGKTTETLKVQFRGKIEKPVEKEEEVKVIVPTTPVVTDPIKNDAIRENTPTPVKIEKPKSGGNTVKQKKTGN